MSFSEAQKYFFHENKKIIPVGLYKYNFNKKKYELLINPFGAAAYENSLIESYDYLVVIAYEEPGFNLDKTHNKKFKGTKLKYFSNNKFTCVDDFCSNSSFKDLDNNNIIICNVNSNLKNIAHELLFGSRKKDFKVSIIIQGKNPEKENPDLYSLNHENLSFIHGDPSDIEVLEKAGVKNCGAAIILADPNYGDYADAPSALTAMEIERINPSIHTVMELIDSSNREYIDFNIINEAVCLGDITEKLIAQNSFNPGVIEIFDNLLTSGKGTPEIFLPEIPDNLINKSFYEIYRISINKKTPFIIIGYIQNNHYHINPGFDGLELEKINAKDSRLIVIAHDYDSINFDGFC
jgi:Trk K+ transport system NAD-binding subunit